MPMATSVPEGPVIVDMASITKAFRPLAVATLLLQVAVRPAAATAVAAYGPTKTA